MVNPTTSGSIDWTHTRDTLIKRALQIVGTLGEGETPSTTQYTESAVILNDIVKEFNVVHGMPLWKIKTYSAFTIVQGTAAYTIGTGATINAVAPLRIIHAYLRDSSVSRDIPLLPITKNQYDLLSDKTTQGYVSQYWYQPPGAPSNVTIANMMGTITLYATPNSYVATNQTLIIIGVTSFEDFDASGDIPDFPSYWNNALAYALANHLSYPAGVPLSERAMIEKKMDKHIGLALGGDTEEGSLFIQPHMQLIDPRSSRGS